MHSSTYDFTTGTSRFSVSGNIEICLGGIFYSICDEGWGQEEAQVACNALNYPSRNYRKLIQYVASCKEVSIVSAVCHLQMPVVVLCMPCMEWMREERLTMH